MIEIKDLSKCCGCEACAQLCPTSAIELLEDGEGFLYPKVNLELCVGCDLCEKVCPELVSGEPRKPLRVVAAESLDPEVRADSSSGGIFFELAKGVVDRGGVVFGACYDDAWQVKHRSVDCAHELAALRRSKYSQSRIGNSFVDAKREVESGREVLFVGTPCHIAALNLFLAGSYPNLTTVDFLCHGVPSPMIWRHYLDSLGVEISNLSQRDKSNGWRRYSVLIEGRAADGSDFRLCEKFFENPFSRGFLRDLYLRPSCYECPSKSFSSGSDITLADFWGVENFLPKDDDKGCSMILTHTQRGEELFATLSNCRGVESEISAIQKIAYSSPKLTSKRKIFFRRFNQGEPFDKIVMDLTKPPFYKKITRPLSKFILGVIKRK